MLCAVAVTGGGIVRGRLCLLLLLDQSGQIGRHISWRKLAQNLVLILQHIDLKF
jgi:hypothetical protein